MIVDIAQAFFWVCAGLGLLALCIGLATLKVSCRLPEHKGTDS